MINSYLPQAVKVIGSVQESIDTRLIRFAFVDKKAQKNFDFIPGQFLQIGLPELGECPISVCSSPHYARQYFELAIRDVGQLSHRLGGLREGDVAYIRGPFGNGFDADKFKDKPLILIGGGCGFAPLRPLIIDYLEERLNNSVLKIFYGCRDEKTLLFKKEFARYKRQADYDVILEKPSSDWKGAKGMITDLLKKNVITDNSIVILVGPPAMYRFAIKELQKKKVKEENIYVSLERRMYCGNGVCQHCAIGPYYVCKDGPVFSYSRIINIPNVI